MFKEPCLWGIEGFWDSVQIGRLKGSNFSHGLTWQWGNNFPFSDGNFWNQDLCLALSSCWLLIVVSGYCSSIPQISRFQIADSHCKEAGVRAGWPSPPIREWTFVQVGMGFIPSFPMYCKKPPVDENPASPPCPLQDGASSTPSYGSSREAHDAERSHLFR